MSNLTRLVARWAREVNEVYLAREVTKYLFTSRSSAVVNLSKYFIYSFNEEINWKAKNKDSKIVNAKSKYFETADDYS